MATTTPDDDDSPSLDMHLPTTPTTSHSSAIAKEAEDEDVDMISNDDVEKPQTSDRINSWNCSFCTSSYKEPHNLDRHMASVHPDSFDTHQYYCERAGCSSETFARARHLHTHLRSHSAANRSPTIAPTTPTTTPKKNKHLVDSQSDCSLPCSQCDRRFQRQSDRSLHYRSAHEGAQVIKKSAQTFSDCDQAWSGTKRQNKARAEFSCLQCGATLSSQRSLNRHWLIHQALKSFQCPICPRSFRERSKLMRHERTHGNDESDNNNNNPTSEMPKQCTLCPYTCHRQSNLTVHMKTMHSAGTKRQETSPPLVTFRCSNCPKVFHRQSNLTVHLRTCHPVESGHNTKFQCTFCRRVFHRGSNLTVHINTRHSSERAPLRYSSSTPIEIEIPLEKPFTTSPEASVKSELDHSDCLIRVVAWSPSGQKRVVETFKAHRHVLADRSPRLRAMLDDAADDAYNTTDDGQKRIDVDNIKPENMRSFIKALYGGTLSESELGGDDGYAAEEILQVADQCSLMDVVLTCERHLLDRIRLERVFHLLQLASVHSAPRLKAACIAFVRANRVAAVLHPTFGTSDLNNALLKELFKATVVEDESEGAATYGAEEEGTEGAGRGGAADT